MSQITKALHPTYISIYQGLQTKKLYMEMTKKYELKMSDDGHFEFYDLWENGATYSLAYGRNGFSTKNSYRTNRWSTFPHKCLQVFIGGYISIIYPDYIGVTLPLLTH